MNAKKFLAAIALVLLLLIAGMIWIVTQYHIVDLKLYPKNAQELDLRGEDISCDHYDKLREKLPLTRIYWDVPFQGFLYPNASKSLTVFSLMDADVAALGYFPQLEVLEASTCRDYPQLAAVRQQYPGLQVNFVLELSGKAFQPNAKKVSLDAISLEEIPLLSMLESLESVAVSGTVAAENVAVLQEFCHGQGYGFLLSIGEEPVADDSRELTISNVTEEQLALLQFLPELKKLELTAPQAPVESLQALTKQYPGVEVSWSQYVAGKLFPHTETLIDISNQEVTDLDAVAAAMTYFPEATQLEMHFCGVENEDMAAFREAHRADYKVVWTVYLGPKLPTRTDTTSIMPARDGTSNFHDAEAYNMRYCEDVIAVDVGHLDVRNVEWAAFMPHLKYLILAWTGVRDLTPLSNSKELIWLELDYSPVKDTTPLIGCTALEDINIGASGIDPSGLCQMPWLKNVWAIFNPGAGYQVAQACPDTRVVATGTHTVSSGWRHLPNYYAMRDALGMFYMDQ